MSIKKKSAVLTVFLILAAAAALFLLLPKRGGSEPLYLTEAVTRGDIDAQIVTTGTLTPVNQVDVGSEISGKIVKIYADFNTVVKKSQLMARLDPADYIDAVEQKDAGVKITEAALEQAKVNLDLARKEYDRNSDLFSKNLISKEEKEAAEESLAAAKETVKTSESDLRQARDDLQSSKIDLAHTDIVAPMDGIVIARLVSEGQTLAARMDAPVLFKVADDISRLRIECAVDEADVGRVKEAEQVVFQVDAFPGEALQGRVVEVRQGADTDQNVVTYKAIVEVDNARTRLKPGMTALVSIHVGEARNVLRIPNGALRFDPPSSISGRVRPANAEPRKKDRVWVLSPQGRPVAVPIKIGLSDSILTELASGELDEGRPVITGLRTALTPGR
jgi:HlyD family secretion protein